MDGVSNDRKPYFVSWKDAQGQMQRIRRTPPPKLHDINAGDEATLDRRLGDDFPSGTNDDLVDSTTQALMRFRQGGFIRLPSDEPEEIEWFKGHRRERFYTV